MLKEHYTLAQRYKLYVLVTKQKQNIDIVFPTRT